MKKFTDGKAFVNPNELEKKCMNETKAIVNEFLKKASGSDRLKRKNKKDLEFRLLRFCGYIKGDNDNRILDYTRMKQEGFNEAVAV